MHLTIPKSKLASALTRAVAAACAGKTTQPVLECVKIDAGRKLTIQATDLALAVEAVVDAKIAKHGAICLHGKELLARVSALPDGDVTIETQDTIALLSSAGSKRKFRMPGLSAEDYPSLPGIATGTKRLSIASEALAGLIDETFASVSQDTTRPHLNSALLEVENGLVRMVSTDGHRLSLAERAEDEAAGHVLSTLVPRAALRTIRRLCDEGERLALYVGPRHLHADTGTCTFSTSLVDAQFPPYRQVIPSERKQVRVPRETLFSAVQAVQLAASEKSRSVSLTLSKNSLAVDAEDHDAGDAHDEIEIDWPGKLVRVGLAASYLVDALAAAGDDEVILDVGGELDPVAIRRVEGRGAWVVMPVRV